jgi:membrane-bound lytic murein transglycosylase D
MALKLRFPKASKNYIPFFIFVTLLFVIQIISAQNQTDTTKWLILASLEKKAEPRFITRKSNVVFPEILKGNEEEMLPYIEKFSNDKRDYLNRMYARGKYILPKAATILKKYGLPEEFRVLLILESEYDGNAVSSAGAVGYWQIMDVMAKHYGMKYTARSIKAEKKKVLELKGKSGENQPETVIKTGDERKNFNKATHAAARYLHDSKQNLDDNWLLVVASYNCGPGNVRKAIKRSGKNNPTFWDIKNYLPSQTRAYVMNFIALSVIFNNYELFAKDNMSFADEKIMLPDDLEKNRAEASVEYSYR